MEPVRYELVAVAVFEIIMLLAAIPIWATFVRDDGEVKRKSPTVVRRMTAPDERPAPAAGPVARPAGPVRQAPAWRERARWEASEVGPGRGRL